MKRVKKAIEQEGLWTIGGGSSNIGGSDDISIDPTWDKPCV